MVTILVVACGPDVGIGHDGDAGTGSGPGSSSGLDGSSSGGEAACGQDGIAVGTVVLRSDEDVALLAGCTSVEGDLYVDPCRVCLDDVQSCSVCSPAQAAGLTSLVGLESLQRISGSLHVGWAEKTFEDGPCTGPTALTSLDGLEGLTSIGGDLQLHCAPALEAAVLPALQQVGLESDGELRVAAQIPVDVEMPELRETGDIRLLGLHRTRVGTPKLEQVRGALQLFDTSIASVEELQHLHAIEGSFDVTDTPLSSLTPIDDLHELGGVYLQGSVPVTRVQLDNVDDFGSLGVEGLQSLEVIRISPQATSMLGIHVVGNPKLVTLEAPGVRDTRWLYIQSNDSLDSLDGLSALETVSEELRIWNNPSLCTSDVDAFVDGLEVGANGTNVIGNADC